MCVYLYMLKADFFFKLLKIIKSFVKLLEGVFSIFAKIKD
jgi:hypothetical protein